MVNNSRIKKNYFNRNIQDCCRLRRNRACQTNLVGRQVTECYNLGLDKEAALETSSFPTDSHFSPNWIAN